MQVLTTAPRSPQVPRLDPSHEAWLRAEHVRWAHTQLRRLRRAEAEGAVAGARRGQGGQADPPEAGEADEIEAPPRDEACDEADEIETPPRGEACDEADEIEAPPRGEACDEADETCTSARDEACDETRTSARDEACDETRTSADAAEEGRLSAVTSTVAPAPPPPSPRPQGHDQRRGEHYQRRGEHDQRRGEHGQRRRKRRKNKGFLAPGGAGDEWAIGLAECRAAAELRERLGVPAGECPSLEQLQRRLPELLSALHDPADSGAE